MKIQCFQRIKKGCYTVRSWTLVGGMNPRTQCFQRLQAPRLNKHTILSRNTLEFTPSRHKPPKTARNTPSFLRTKIRTIPWKPPIALNSKLFSLQKFLRQNACSCEKNAKKREKMARNTWQIAGFVVKSIVSNKGSATPLLLLKRANSQLYKERELWQIQH